MGAGAIGETRLVSRRLDRRTGTTTPVAWTAPEDIEVLDWVQMGRRLGATTRCSQWWLGDWIRYGTARWGEKYKEASRITGYDVQSLRNIAYVAGSFEVSRRRDDLTWSHHAEVSPLEPEEQDRWLALAASQRMSVADLRIELRAARRRNSALEASVESSADAGPGVVMCPKCTHEFKASASKADAG